MKGILPRALALALLALASALPAAAGPFEVAITPSRFELGSKPGGRVGQSLTIFNVGTAQTEVAIRTLDWSYTPAGAVTYHEELLPGSCRPWVTLERRTLRVAPRGRSSFRFQIDVPADAKRIECRFMLAVEGAQPAYQVQMDGTGAQLSLPVNGRIAVAVYLSVDGATPKLEVREVSVATVNGKRTPVVTVANTGDAHARLEGSLEAVTPTGQKLELVPEGTPILPGQTRTLPFSARGEANQRPPEIVLPLKASGQLDWSQGSFKIATEFK